MLPKLLIVVFLVILGIFAFGLISKGGFGPPLASFRTEPSQSKQLTACPNPLVPQTPIDLNLVTSVYYPGQIRTGGYKPHGAFRFDNSKNDDIEVMIPVDGELTDGVRYIEDGVVQYMFDFMHPCGIRYRLDHLLTLSPKFAKVVENLPEPKVNDSRTSRLTPPVKVQQGEVVATAVGLGKDVFVDFGVYDMREYGLDNLKEAALCFLDHLPPEDATKVKSLAAATGKQSDICK